MKMKRTVLLIALFVACGAVGRQPVGDLNGPKQPSTQNDPAESPDETIISPADHGEVVVDNQRLATRPLKVQKIGDKTERADGLGSRAWTSLVGWHPGGSAFADPMTHESQLNLLTFHGRKKSE